MLLYKSWLETRWRFTIGFFVLAGSAAALVLLWPKTLQLLPLADSLDIRGEMGRRIKEAVDVQRSFRGYIWSKGFAQNLTSMITLFAVLLGTGGLLSSASRSALFTLSLPVTRNRIAWVCAATGLAELLALAFASAVSIASLAPSVGENYAYSDALIHGVCLFSAAAVFFGLAALLSTVFGDFWRPLAIALAIAVGIGLLELASGGLAGFGVFHLMSGEAWFRHRQFPWAGIAASLAAAGVLLWSAALLTARRDF